MTAVDVDALDKLRAAMERWLRDRVQVPDHRAITASYAFVELPEIADLLAEVCRGRALREAVEGLPGALRALAGVAANGDYGRGVAAGYRTAADNLTAVLAAVDGGGQ